MILELVIDHRRSSYFLEGEPSDVGGVRAWEIRVATMIPMSHRRYIEEKTGLATKTAYTCSTFSANFSLTFSSFGGMCIRQYAWFGFFSKKSWWCASAS